MLAGAPRQRGAAPGESFLSTLDAQAPRIRSIRMGDLIVSDTLLGQGGFGSVFAGSWMHARVAIKKLETSTSRAKVADAFEREVLKWSHLNHPNILPLLGVAQDDTARFMVSPLMINGNVRRYLKQNAAVNRMTLIYNVAAGLHYLHSEDFIHSDLKPLNILVNGGGEAVISDFGASRFTLPDRPSTGGVRPGTDRYMAPERVMNRHLRVTKEMDVYSFALTAYEIYTSDSPYSHLVEGYDLHGAITACERKFLVNCTEMPKPLRDILLRCSVKDPHARPKMDEVANIIAVLAAEHMEPVIGTQDTYSSSSDSSYAIMGPSSRSPIRAPPANPIQPVPSPAVASPPSATSPGSEAGYTPPWGTPALVSPATPLVGNPSDRSFTPTQQQPLMPHGLSPYRHSPFQPARGSQEFPPGAAPPHCFWGESPPQFNDSLGVDYYSQPDQVVDGGTDVRESIGDDLSFRCKSDDTDMDVDDSTGPTSDDDIPRGTPPLPKRLPYYHHQESFVARTPAPRSPLGAAILAPRSITPTQVNPHQGQPAPYSPSPLRNAPNNTLARKRSLSSDSDSEYAISDDENGSDTIHDRVFNNGVRLGRELRQRRTPGGGGPQPGRRNPTRVKRPTTLKEEDYQSQEFASQPI
ncbi:hypothetical protein HDU93_008064 [Gonapodya sp. JEL0774]|nr:hypothetical protein HDU93_008064 [Gonapodya sp. JEL0774]